MMVELITARTQNTLSNWLSFILSMVIKSREEEEEDSAIEGTVFLAVRRMVGVGAGSGVENSR
jgi:hypothetical protein